MKMSVGERDKKLSDIESCYENKTLTNDEAKKARFEVWKEFNQGFEVGDGATYHLWTDSHACTIIARTEDTITLQRDKATLDANFVPKYSDNGFDCINGKEQSYTYERDDKGEKIVAYWNEEHGAFRYLGKTVIAGRYEFYDYNF